MARKTAAQLGVDEVSVIDFVSAGSVRAADMGGMSDDVSCVCCGARIVNVFITNAGPMGGDCAATLGGDDATRNAVRVAVRAVSGYLRARKNVRVRVQDGSIFCGSKFICRLRSDEWARVAAAIAVDAFDDARLV